MSKRDRKKGRWRPSTTSWLTPSGRARRRYNCGEQDEWEERAIAAASPLAEQGRVWKRETGRPVAIADLGAGNERMRAVLAATLDVEHTYHPYDLHPQKATTIRLDVTKGLPERHFDIAIALGLLEYLPSIPALAMALRKRCRFALTSYVVADGPGGIGRRDREERNWSTHATEAGLRADFASAGFRPVASVWSDNGATSISLWGDG